MRDATSVDKTSGSGNLLVVGPGKRRKEKLAQAFSTRVGEVFFGFCFIVAGAMCSLLGRHHERYTWKLAVKIVATFERECLELHHRYSEPPQFVGASGIFI